MRWFDRGVGDSPATHAVMVFVRTRSGVLVGGFGVGGRGGDAGLALLRLSRVICWMFSLSLLATARGGASIPCPKRQRNEAKKALSNQGRVSVPSVQFYVSG